MIIDSHCHAWPLWPYQPPVPDDASRGRVEQLLHEMDLHGVDQAAVVCAQIERNGINNAYVAQQVARFPKRLHQFADVDSSWSKTYHTAGAAHRLHDAAESWPLKGFTHYLKHEDDGAWMHSEEGQAFFAAAASRGLIASIAAYPHHQPALRKVAERFPSMPFLCHHLGVVKAADKPEKGLNEVLASAKLPNIYIKLSGFAYAATVAWEYPYHETHPVIRAIYEQYGSKRLCWGSDYPVVRFFMTYQQSLEAFRTHCTFVPESEKADILGDNLARLLARGKEVAATKSSPSTRAAKP